MSNFAEQSPSGFSLLTAALIYQGYPPTLETIFYIGFLVTITVKLLLVSLHI